MKRDTECYNFYRERLDRNNPTIYMDILEALAQHKELHVNDLPEIAGYNYLYIRSALPRLTAFELLARVQTPAGIVLILTERGRIAVALHVAKRNIKNARATRAKLSNRADCTRGHKVA